MPAYYAAACAILTPTLTLVLTFSAKNLHTDFSCFGERSYQIWLYTMLFSRQEPDGTNEKTDDRK